MESTLTTHHKNVGIITHISVFSKYIIPFGNFIIPLVLWLSNKNNSPFVDETGKRVLNFQLSLLLYAIIFAIISLPFALLFAGDIFHFFSITDINSRVLNFNLNPFSHSFWIKGIFMAFIGIIAMGLKFLFDVVFVIIGAIKASNGEIYHYPLTINFIK
ncbi:DUF4870 domain-containing protein [Zhouia sp. PK063]|uniref:DUF4870 domain-containing protein n=1 Tax=Zhouia sp. PK063 TaxID=3373602 RepID=UPI00379B773C